ncbi:BTAD domain-containing putative transcriptional regulator [Streptomyces sp. NPDC047841]|uniref:BTAD domain-containing putative transcriptional regulator n=1 Tax=Streptomyces sp. NPDC047841 TaxID=3154708 RepID=UPI0034535B0D
MQFRVARTAGRRGRDGVGCGHGPSLSSRSSPSPAAPPPGRCCSVPVIRWTGGWVLAACRCRLPRPAELPGPGRSGSAGGRCGRPDGLRRTVHHGPGPLAGRGGARRTWNHEYVSVVCEAADTALRCRRAEAVLLPLRQAAERHPLDEVLLARLLSAPASDGKQAEDLVLYEVIWRGAWGGGTTGPPPCGPPRGAARTAEDGEGMAQTHQGLAGALRHLGGAPAGPPHPDERGEHTHGNRPAHPAPDHGDGGRGTQAAGRPRRGRRGPRGGA